MGYFDGLTDAAFKKSHTGQTIYYPWGVFGSGYVVESEEKQEQIRKFLKRLYVILLLTIVTVQITVGFWLNAVLFPAFWVWYYFSVQKMNKNSPRTAEKLRLSESYKNSAKSHNLGILIILEVFAVGFVAAGVLILLKGGDQLVAMSSMGFFGLCGIAFGYMIYIKIRHRSA